MDKLWFVVLLLLLQTKISSQDCGKRFIDEDDVSRTKRIIGGNEAAMNSWPWIVNFMHEDMTIQVCAGNLIHPQWILTTAHCFVSRVFKLSVDKWTYIAGDHYVNETDPYEQELYPDKLYIHPKYVLMSDLSPGDYDLALIRLKKPAKISPQVQTICLPNEDEDDDFENKTHFVVGWGNTYDTPKYTRSNYLKELRMEIVPKATCNRSYGGNVTQRQVCAAHPGGGQDACFGDSGGPLQYMNEDGKWVISGVVSWGIGCARKNLYGVYTNVKALLPFIHKVLKENMTCGVRQKSYSRPKRIVGGSEAAMNAWPWTVNIVHEETQTQTCGGSIIASNWILTAAHCFLGHGRKTSVGDFEYHVGDHVVDVIDEEQRQVVPEFYYIHPDYISPTLTHPGNFDVCLIKLKYSLDWSSAVNPICLPPDNPNSPSTENLQCYAVGWGNTGDNRDYNRPRALKQLRVDLISHERCNSNVSYNGSVPDTYICAGFPEGLNDTCYGDSGGPLQCDNGDDSWSLRGLVSWGIGCARPNKFGVYLNVSKYIPFIKKVMSGRDLRLQKIGKMTVEEIYEQQPTEMSFAQLCSLTLLSIIQFAQRHVTTTDVVRTWALIPSQIALLKIATPNDIAVAFGWHVKNTCKTRTLEDYFEIAHRVDINAQNDTLRKFSEQLNLTVDEMAFFFRWTVGSLLLVPNIQFENVQRRVNQGRLVEDRVSRMMQLVDFLKSLQPGTWFEENKLKEIVRNYPYKIAKNLTDSSLKRIISTNHIDVFTKYVSLKNLGNFFGNLSLDELRMMNLSEIVFNLIGLDRDDFVNRFSSLDVENSLEDNINNVEMYWDISSEWLTLEQLLIAWRFKEDKFNCNHCDVSSVPHCNIVCARCASEECRPVNKIIEGPKVRNIKLALIFGVFSGCLVALIIILLICFISKQHRARNASTSEKVMTDDEMGKSSESLAYKTTSNNNIVFLPQNKAMNGKTGSYVALECCDKQENKRNGNLESIL